MIDFFALAVRLAAWTVAGRGTRCRSIFILFRPQLSGLSLKIGRPLRLGRGRTTATRQHDSNDDAAVQFSISGAQWGTEYARHPDLGHGRHANERSLDVLTTGLGVGFLRISERDTRFSGLVIESNTPRLARGARTKFLHVAYSPTLHWRASRIDAKDFTRVDGVHGGSRGPHRKVRKRLARNRH